MKNVTNRVSRIAEGTVYFSKSENKWRAEVKWVDPDGEKHTKKFSAKKRNMACAKLNNFKCDLTQYLDDEEEKRAKASSEVPWSVNEKSSNIISPSFKDFSELWLEKFKKPNLKISSYARVEGIVNNQVIPYLGHLKMNEITIFDVQNMVNCLMESGLSYSTTKKAYEAVNGCMKKYGICNRMFVNPCDGVEFSQKAAKEPMKIRFYTEDECKMICEEATRAYNNGTLIYRYGYAVIALMYTGVRIGELLALTWDDIDFDKKEITVNKNVVVAKDEESGKFVHYNQDSTKSESGTRTVHLCKMAEYAFVKMKGLRCYNSKYVVSTQNGKQVHPGDINRTFYSILKITNLYATDGKTKNGVHNLRHTFASMLFKNGCSIKDVSVILGHSDTGVTENLYIHLTQEYVNLKIVDIDKYITKDAYESFCGKENIA